ncbi:MAG: SDR family oxidoreductase [Candidatus Levybacteria bacterium]|nr:SDR family oxidoreductase [Candidatus Levybacteria bacterium]
MNVLLTGVTGNLGNEVAIELLNRGINVIPILRLSRRLEFLQKDFHFSETLVADLLQPLELNTQTIIDCVVHCAGDVNFLGGGEINRKMIANIIVFAKKYNIPIFHISTAFIYNKSNGFNNNYELDKFNTEKLLENSGIAYSIVRPSVIVGNSRTGKIINSSGYYEIVNRFVKVAQKARKENIKIRYPKLLGKSDMVPVDQVADCIVNLVQSNKLNMVYATNPNPPDASWVFSRSMAFFGLLETFDIINCTFEEFGKLQLNEYENDLYLFGKHFNRYWDYNGKFPNTSIVKNSIDEVFLKRTLTFFEKFMLSKYETAMH